ncbi:MAG: hypothetical protein E7270_08625 [Lachnospiraceae bacterium]|nr:hypothetical protein [Lachnospiraceae bacterium]
MKKITLLIIICVFFTGCGKRDVKQNVTNSEKTTTEASTELLTSENTTIEPATEETTKETTEETTEKEVELDPTLEEAIRIELGITAEAELTDDMLKEMTYLAAFETNIDSLAGISKLVNLTELHISKGNIRDISELKELKNLTFIDIANCYVTEIPDFSALENLSSLYLGGNLIEDVTPISKVTSLRYVDLSCNRIKSISPMADCNFLEGLVIDGNCILDYYTIKDSLGLIEAIDYFSQCKVSYCIEVEEKAKSIVKAFPKNLTELELEKVIYQYIIDNVEYDVVDGNDTAFGYEALIGGVGVCGHYADGFCLLANHAGIEAYVCNSETHAWNIVKIDGKYYHCDALWDEGVDEWSYFNVGADYILNTPDHTYEINKYPICE